MFVGDSNVGKSSLINSFMGVEGEKKIDPTIGVDIFFKKYRVKKDMQYVNVIF